ncbi:ABC transporter ATP-binding protein [Vibrio nigripulchritudo ATCC 27043]|uniref:ABC transporter ATP-binding protein n=1 Tax=Vibrio nigripulchritudo TaxID=28173 RepID=UPI00021C31B2|nr:ABC transporter ATP-binding protein [Vibrio nigripulchritudo]EGU56168.1 ABC transporter ATP-binding protein [Vibrio nigripulchritudo ATCC 27043]
MNGYLKLNSVCASLPDQTPLLRNVSFEVEQGTVHGLVGESGAGKSMIGKALLGTLPRAVSLSQGDIRLDGVSLQNLDLKARRRWIGKNTALIPQDPLTALNPSRRIGPQITSKLIDILGWSKRNANMRAMMLLEEVGIPNPHRVIKSYPHELSGGMRQRVLIAAAFAANPKLIVADEPTTALDVTVQKQILRLIRELQHQHSTTILFVTHDLGVVAKICQSLSVLYGGKVLETAKVEAFFQAPQHPYSSALLEATPRYTHPEQSLKPVPSSVIQMTKLEVINGSKERNHDAKVV